MHEHSNYGACFLCLEISENQIKIFSDEGRELNVKYVITKYFWLQLPDESNKAQICLPCWYTLSQFHELYERVAKAHNYLKDSEQIVSVETDPLPNAPNIPKCENTNNDRQELVEALADNFFDSEIKVEVNDLDLLPPVEIIEDTPYVSDRALRANRRYRQLDEDTSNKLVSHKKRIKKESTSDTILDIKTDIIKQTEDTIQSRKRRGRPRKIRPTNETCTEDFATNKNDMPVKEEIEGNSGDGTSFMDQCADFETEDSAPSSSESDSGKSLPDAVPEERYAVIPKRKVLKPKKYRKRAKPLVPPRRMTREEIDKRNAQQAAYDEIISKFFEKYSCPKCNLLVQNFGEMKKHFRASHGDEPGYMTCCGRKFQLRKNMAEHIYVHWNPEHFKCSISDCGKIFQDSRSLELHELWHKNPPEPKEKKTYQCEKCPKAYTTKAALEHHLFSKHVPKSEFQFPCKECGKKLPTLRKLKDHMKYAHDPESAIICDKCGKQMRSQSNLKKHHQLEHSEAPRPVPVPMQCEICGTWLKHLAGLKQHMRSLHEETGGEYRCHICNKTSTNSRALKRHIYHNHECERKFKCSMCEKAFKRPQDLREHTSTHTGEVLYTCPNCPMTFFSNANMYKHRQRLHRAQYEADRKKPVPPNIRQQAICATAASKMKPSIGTATTFFPHS